MQVLNEWVGPRDKLRMLRFLNDLCRRLGFLHLFICKCVGPLLLKALRELLFFVESVQFLLQLVSLIESGGSREQDFEDALLFLFFVGFLVPLDEIERRLVVLLEVL